MLSGQAGSSVVAAYEGGEAGPDALRPAQIQEASAWCRRSIEDVNAWLAGDRESGAELVTLLFDLEADPLPETSPPPWEPADPPGRDDLTRIAAEDLVEMPRRFLQLGRQILQQGATYLSHTAGIDRFRIHPGFPVDIRHNAKIFREKLALWAGTA